MVTGENIPRLRFGADMLCSPGVRILILLGCALAGPLFPGVAMARDPMQVVPPEQGVPAPNCAYSTKDDQKTADLDQYRGKVVYVDFWASWCGPCAQSFPFLNALNQQFHDQGLQVVGVDMDEDPADAQAFLARHQPNFTIAVPKSEKCAQDFSVQGMPSSYLVDRNGLVRHVQIGFRPGAAPALRDMVGQLLAEKPAAPSN